MGKTEKGIEEEKRKSTTTIRRKRRRLKKLRKSNRLCLDRLRAHLVMS
jgi:uncharacterized protein YerC